MKFLLLPALAGALVLGACSAEKTTAAGENGSNADSKAQQVSFLVEGMT
jgi:hypothetical protein